MRIIHRLDFHLRYLQYNELPMHCLKIIIYEKEYETKKVCVFLWR